MAGRPVPFRRPATVFADRVDAGRRLARSLTHLRGTDPVVVGLPRGGVPVAAMVADALRAPLDVIVVRKLGVPDQTELAMGAIGEDDVRVLNHDVLRAARVTTDELAAVETRERAELTRRAHRFRAGRDRIPLAGRVVVVVDDGIATGSTARAACEVAGAEGAARIVLAVPVAPPGWTRRLAGAADEYVCVDTPESFHAVGQRYRDFSQTTDDEVVRWLHAASGDTEGDAAGDADPPGLGGPVFDGPVTVHAGPDELAGHLTVPAHAAGVVVFAHGSGSSRHSPRNRAVARVLNDAGLATLLFDLLRPDEELDRANAYDIDLLARRLHDATVWVRDRPEAAGLAVGYFGASTGAAAALVATTLPGTTVAAVVSRGGRPDLAGPSLAAVRAPTLLVVGSRDRLVLDLNRQALARLSCPRELTVIPGATHLFDEAGTLRAAAEAARDWFLAHLADRAPSPAERRPNP